MVDDWRVDTLKRLIGIPNYDEVTSSTFYANLQYYTVEIFSHNTVVCTRSPTFYYHFITHKMQLLSSAVLGCSSDFAVVVSVTLLHEFIHLRILLSSLGRFKQMIGSLEVDSVVYSPRNRCRKHRTDGRADWRRSAESTSVVWQHMHTQSCRDSPPPPRPLIRD